MELQRDYFDYVISNLYFNFSKDPNSRASIGQINLIWTMVKHLSKEQFDKKISIISEKEFPKNIKLAFGGSGAGAKGLTCSWKGCTLFGSVSATGAKKDSLCTWHVYVVEEVKNRNNKTAFWEWREDMRKNFPHDNRFNKIEWHMVCGDEY